MKCLCKLTHSRHGHIDVNGKRSLQLCVDHICCFFKMYNHPG